MKPRIIVACGGAVATSTIATARIEELCRKHQIDAEICQMRISEIATSLTGVVLIVTTTKVKKDYGIPLISGMPFITGIGEEKTEQMILDVMKKQTS